jgi:hypothetical protein
MPISRMAFVPAHPDDWYCRAYRTQCFIGGIGVDHYRVVAGCEPASNIDYPYPVRLYRACGVNWGVVRGYDWEDSPAAAGSGRVDQRDRAGPGAIAQHGQTGAALGG